MPEQRTWTLRHSYHGIWEGHGKPKGWMPLGIGTLDCGCCVDTFNGGTTWEPCMAHESEGHLAAISEQDDGIVARCVILTCEWHETHIWESDAISAAQEHWRETRTAS